MAQTKYQIICGHYGCGKTNLSLNLALNAAAEGKVTLVDLDIVNPYFRSSDYAQLLRDGGVNLIAASYAGTNLDLPSLPPELYSVFSVGGLVIFDVGGDDSGATALGRLAATLRGCDYEMLYVVNRYRNLTVEPEQSLRLLGEIEAACRLRATGIVNNSHLKQQTTEKVIRDALDYGAECARLAGLPLKFTTAPRELSDSLMDIDNLLPIDVYVKTPWGT